MKITSAEFIYSAPHLRYCKKTNLPEFAFIGRSNVGKSSLINMLVNVKNLAKTSSTPGKTKLINFFLINKKFYFVDLPGYGYARMSIEERKKLNEMIESYILYRKNLLNLFVLVDIRLKPQTSDINFINSLGENKVPFVILFTKADKLSYNNLIKNRKNFENELLKYWDELPKMFVTSSVTHYGKEEVLNYIEELVNNHNIKNKN